MNCIYRVSIAALLIGAISLGADQTTYQLNYMSPADAQHALNPQTSPNGPMLVFDQDAVWLHFNEANNQIKLTGSTNAIRQVQELLQFYDVPPRQIIIEVQIMEVNRRKFDQIGLDWQYFISRFGFSAAVNVNGDTQKADSEREYPDDPTSNLHSIQTQANQTGHTTLNIGLSSVKLGDLIQLIQDRGAGKLVAAPRIVTTNNREGSILDGDHTTYVSRYSSYANIYETQEINSGLSLKVTPSIGAQDFLTLNIEAKYTYLSGSLSGSPVETGQILKNRIIARNNNPFLLGAFKKTVSQTTKRKVPVLGWILPYLFSREITSAVQRDILIILKPQIIDLQGSVVPDTGL